MEKKIILLVEDDGTFRDLIKGAFERQYNILEASSCSEAIKQIKKPIDLALIDYSLPDGDGLDILKALREANRELPVIMMTAYSTEDLAIKAFRSGATDYLKKPFTFTYLTGKLSEIFEGKKNGEEPESATGREVFIMDCIAAFIEENYTKKMTRDELAAKACMDRYKFSKMFNERFGQGMKSYLNTIRIKKAAELLQNQELGVAEVAFSVGYGSVPHFCRVFREAYGLSPKEHREKVLFI